jgi:hypothetical protein
MRTLTLPEGLRARRHPSSRVRCTPCTLDRRGEKFRELTDTSVPNWKLVSSARGIKLAPMPQKLDAEEREIRVVLYSLFPLLFISLAPVMYV